MEVVAWHVVAQVRGLTVVIVGGCLLHDVAEREMR